MKGMKKTSGEFQTNNVCQVMNMCMAPETVVRRNEKVRKASRVSAKEIVAIIMMILGMAAVILSIVDLYLITICSQHVFMNMDVALVILTGAFVLFIWGIRLAWNS